MGAAAPLWVHARVTMGDGNRCRGCSVRLASGIMRLRRQFRRLHIPHARIRRR